MSRQPTEENLCAYDRSCIDREFLVVSFSSAAGELRSVIMTISAFDRESRSCSGMIDDLLVS